MSAPVPLFGRMWRYLRGVAAVEFAICAPLLLFTFGGVADMGLSLRYQERLAQAVANGGQYAFKVGPTVTASSVQSMVQASSGLSGVSAVVSGPSLGCASGSPATLVAGTAGHACADGTQPGTYITITATVTYTQILPHISTFISPTLQQSEIVRLQ